MIPNLSLSPNLSRRGLIGLGAAAGAGALASCSGMGGGGKKEGGDAGKLQFWSNHPGTSKKLEQEFIEGFQKKNPDVKVTLIDAGKDYEEVAQKFNAALSGGGLPDIVVVSDVTWFNFALNEQLAPLEDLFDDAGVDPKDYVQPLYEDYVFQDKHYALPYARSTPLFYYNTEMWKKAGLPDQGPKDWDQMREWADALKSKAGAKLALVSGDGANYLDWIFEGLNWSMGGSYSDEFTPTFTKKETIEAGEFLKEFTGKKLWGVSTDPAPVFASGQAAVCVESTGSLKGILDSAKFKVGTAFLPGPEGESCPTGGAGLAIPAGISKERQVNALKAIGYFTNTENTATFALGTGYMPVRPDATESDTIKDYLKKVPQAKTALDQLPHTKPQDAARVFVSGGGRQIGGGLDKIVQGGDVKDVFGDLQDWAKPKLEQLAKKAK